MGTQSKTVTDNLWSEHPPPAANAEAVSQRSRYSTLVIKNETKKCQTKNGRLNTTPRSSHIVQHRRKIGTRKWSLLLPISIFLFYCVHIFKSKMLRFTLNDYLVAKSQHSQFKESVQLAFTEVANRKYSGAWNSMDLMLRILSFNRKKSRHSASQSHTGAQNG